MKRYHLIINPEAGRGRSGKAIPAIRDWLSSHSLSWEISLTSAPGEAELIAREKAAEDTILVAAGGDGTLNETVNGARDRNCTLAILPLGSGNDFVKNLNIPSDLQASLEILISGNTLNVDAGEINGRIFTNSIAMGIDGAVAEEMNKASALPPDLAYHYGVLKNVFFFRNRSIRWKSEQSTDQHRVNLASVMNGHTYGGSYQVAPQARIDDGYLDFVAVGDYKILGRILHLPKLKHGKHLDLKKVTHFRFRELILESDSYVPVAIDGELLKERSPKLEFSIRVLPGGLKVITGLA